MNSWISVRNWRKFQHYDPSKRRPVWIKTHLDLLSSDDYRDLSAGARAVLHGIWLEYASTQCQLKFDAKSLSTRLNLRVTKQQLETLVDAGFIDIVASKLLADGYQDASPEVEKKREEKPPNPNPVVDAPEPADDDIDFDNIRSIVNGHVPILKDIPA